MTTRATKPNPMKRYPAVPGRTDVEVDRLVEAANAAHHTAVVLNDRKSWERYFDAQAACYIALGQLA